MEIVILFALTILPMLLPPDPAPGLSRSKERSRSMDCIRISAEEASAHYPGQVITSDGRGDYVERTAMICRQRLMRPGLRDARDEAVLNALDATTLNLATSAEARRPDLREHTWLVDAYYPNAKVGSKITFSTKNALMGLGLQVADRTLALNATEVEIIQRLHPDEAYPAACRRYAENGTLGKEDALLAVVSRDRRATVLHAGLCVDGVWAWIE